jgi:adenosylcobinamide-GDP ribazoletransferase
MQVARAAAAAVAFLTRVPVGRWIALDGADVARGAALFPVVGAGVGALGGLVAAGLERSSPPFVAGAVGIAACALVTGALHLDALADTADALGGVDRARALLIMRDPGGGLYARDGPRSSWVEVGSLGGLP